MRPIETSSGRRCGGRRFQPHALRVEFVEMLHETDERIDSLISDLPAEGGHGVAIWITQVFTRIENRSAKITLGRFVLFAWTDEVRERLTAVDFARRAHLVALPHIARAVIVAP